MWQVISRDLRSLLTVARCTLCKAALRDEDSEPALCPNCSQSLPVDTTPLRGCSPIPWMAAGLYEGRLRHLILAMRQSPDRGLLNALSRTLRDELPRNAVLVPVPSWKRGSRANALPAQFMQALCRDSCTELLRRRPGVGQHHLSQRQRWRNVNGTFAVDRTATVRCDWTDRRVWIVDDVLTTGATLKAVAKALRDAGVPVGGGVCLGRTPPQARDHPNGQTRPLGDLQSRSHFGDGPG